MLTARRPTPLRCARTLRMCGRRAESVGSEVGAAGEPHPRDCQPLHRRPPVGSIPLLARGDQRRDEPARLEEIPLEARCYRATPLRAREPEEERNRSRQGRAVRYALAAPP